MTSSLVGSEMCIRDRGRPRESKRCLRRHVQEAARARRAASCTWRRRPVSYTHLTLPTICSV
eukprot:1817638-Prorocentrum_lima.AAC.1